METFLALIPIFVFFLFLFAFRQSAVRAGIAAYGAALLITSIAADFHVAWQQLLSSTVRGGLISLIVAYVILFGIFLYHLMNEEGLLQKIADFVANSTSDPVRQVMMLVVAFSPLVESVTGFGIAIIVTAPLLDRYESSSLHHETMVAGQRVHTPVCFHVTNHVGCSHDRCVGTRNGQLLWPCICGLFPVDRRIGRLPYRKQCCSQCHVDSTASTNGSPVGIVARYARSRPKHKCIAHDDGLPFSCFAGQFSKRKFI